MRRALIITATALTALAVTVIPVLAQPITPRATSTHSNETQPRTRRSERREGYRAPDPCRPGDAPCWRAHINRRIWMAELARQERYARLLRYAAAVAAARTYPHGLCGGDLPPCYVMRRESGGNITAQNPRSTASGKWQVLDSTWRGYGGVRKARYASEQVQDDFARRLWDHGAGCSHWSAC